MQMEKNNTSNRIALWDNFKFFLILTVVIGHFTDYYTGKYAEMKSLFLFIYLFHMPAFVFISGLFSKDAIARKRYDKVIGYLILYLFMQILIYFTKLIFYGKASLSLLSVSATPWFAFALAAFFAITISLRSFNPKKVIIISVALACVAGYDTQIGDFLVLSRIITFYPFFYIGYQLDSNKLIYWLKTKRKQILSVIILISVAYICINHLSPVYGIRPILTGRNPYYKLSMFSEIGFLLRLFWYISSFTLIFAFISIMPNKQSIISSMGSRSVQVYALHRPIIYIWQAIGMDNITRSISSEYWLYLTVFGGAIIITVLLSAKIFSKPFKYILNPTK